MIKALYKCITLLYFTFVVESCQTLRVHAKTCGEKEVVRELENDEHVSLKANVSPFPLIFFSISGFRILPYYMALSHKDWELPSSRI